MQEDKDKPSAYNISSYDSVFILLKSKNDLYKDILKHDKAKNRYYIECIILDPEKAHSRYHTLSVVSLSDISEFKKFKKFSDKQKFIHTVMFGDIDFISLDFNSFDWK